MNTIGIIFVYIVLFVLGIKLYLWGRKQQKKHAPKWGWRLTILFFFAPVIIFFIDLIFPIPDKGITFLKTVIQYIDYPIVWLDGHVKSAIGWWSMFVKPVITAFFYAIIGFTLGSALDSVQKKK